MPVPVWPPERSTRWTAREVFKSKGLIRLAILRKFAAKAVCQKNYKRYVSTGSYVSTGGFQGRQSYGKL